MSASRRRAAVALALWSAVIFLAGALVGVGPTAGQEPNRAGLVVTFEEGRTEYTCVEFDEEEITGVELLRRSGLAAVFSAAGPYGEGVCSIDGTGCDDPGNCYCQCHGAGCAFWAYFTPRDEGGWRFMQIGPAQRRLSNGDVDAWVWGNGRVPPDDLSFGEICPLPRQEEPNPGAAPLETATPGAQIAEGGTVVSHVTAAATARAKATPSSAATATQASVLRDDEASSGSAADGASEDEGGGAPAGLIAFGAVAGALALGTGAYALRRRVRG